MNATEKISRWLEWVVTGIEWVVAAALVVLAALATWGIIAEFFALGLGPQETAAYTTILDGTLFVFVVAELFKIAFAYIRHERVIATVMEAAFVAIARKIVILDTHVAAQELLMRAGSLALLLLAVGVSWLLLTRTNPEFGRIPPRDH